MKISEMDLRRSKFAYFLGKIVILLTNAASMNYDTSEKGTFIHFRNYGGICEGFDEFGIWLKEAQSNTKSFFFYSQIQGIVEQEQATEDHPLVKEALKKPSQPEPPLINISFDKLKKMVDKNIKST